MTIKLNGLGHVGGCGCGSCSGCSVPSSLKGLGGPVTHLDYSQYKQGGYVATPTGASTSWLDSLNPNLPQTPPDLYRPESGGPSAGMNSRTQQQEAWERGGKVGTSYTDVINGNMDKVGAKAAQAKALDRAARETDPLARARALEDARAYGDEAARLAEGGPMRPGVPVKRTVQWEEATSGGYAEIQQREMERRGIKTYRPPGWQPNAETERLRAKREAEQAALKVKLAKQKAEQQARRAEQERINRERAAALKARADAEKARQEQARRDRQAAEREARARKVLDDAERANTNAVVIAQPGYSFRPVAPKAATPYVHTPAPVARTAQWAVPVSQQARQATQAQQYRPGGVKASVYNLMGLGDEEATRWRAIDLALAAGIAYYSLDVLLRWSRERKVGAERRAAGRRGVW